MWWEPMFGLGALRGQMLTSMFVFKRSGRRAQVGFMPGCLIWSLLLSIGLTILINVLIRLL
jgi:hypothetical protein